MSRPATTGASTLTRDQRRHSLAAAYLSAFLWGLGSGLASTTLIVFLARRQGASGLAIAWILAAPSLVGLLRLATPAWLDRVASRRRFCVGIFLSSAMMLAALPALAAPGVIPSRSGATMAMGAAWAMFQLLDYIGVIALWSWLGDLVPARVRGSFLGRREACLNGGAMTGSVLAIAVSALWDRLSLLFGAGDVQWNAYATCAVAGALSFAMASVALLRMADMSHGPATSGAARFQWRSLLAPIVDRRFRSFMTFGVWFSISNGLIQAAQTLYPIGPLGISFGVKKTLDGALRGGKAALLPRVGRLIDRRGNVPVLAAGQAMIALAPLLFLYASPAAPWWIVGAYGCWLAYSCHDIALPNLMLGLSAPGESASYAAAWFAWTQLAYSLSTLAGGALLDWFTESWEPISLAGRPIDHYFVLFLGSWALKSFGVPLAARIRDPQSHSI
jgi:MFS family permease